MASPKAMGLGAMLIFLVLAVSVLPFIVRYINRLETDYIVSGFEDKKAEQFEDGADGFEEGFEDGADGFEDEDGAQGFEDGADGFEDGADGFEDGFESFQNGGDVQNIPSVKKSPSFVPDNNTNYMCNTVCPEGSRCDGVLNQCVGLTYPGKSDPVGYYS